MCVCCVATPEVTPLPEADRHKRVKVGENLELSVEARCDPGPLDYVWFHNRKPLPGVNSPRLTLRSVGTGHAGTNIQVEYITLPISLT